MVKKILAVLVCVAVLFAVVGCVRDNNNNEDDIIDNNENNNQNQNNNNENNNENNDVTENENNENTDNVGVTNPVKEYATASEIETVAGFPLKVPSNATNVRFSTINESDPQTLVAQAEYDLDGVSYTLRASRNVTGQELNGLYFDEQSTENLDFSGLSVTHRVLGEDWRVLEWTENGVNYVLYAQNVEVDAFNTYFDEFSAE